MGIVDRARGEKAGVAGVPPCWVKGLTTGVPAVGPGFGVAVPSVLGGNVAPSVRSAKHGDEPVALRWCAE